MENYLLLTFNGISIGAILLLVALGLAFSFGLMRVINMAHGEFILIGAYTTYYFQEFLAEKLRGPDGAKEGYVFLLSIVAAFVVAGALGMLLEQFLIRHLYGRPLDTLLATWGVGLVIQQAARSYDARNLPVTSPDWLRGGYEVTPIIFLPYKRLFIIGLAIVCIVLVYLYLYRTPYGRRTRAVMENREMASALGVSTRRIDSYTFGLGTGLAGVAGAAITQLGQIGPQLGTSYIVEAFLVVVLGGVGRLPGVVLAAVIIGLSSSFSEFYTTATLGKVIVFTVIILFLQIRPQGLVSVQARA
jgi:urea transport system permease protein